MHRLSRHAGRFALAAALLLCAGTVWLRGQDDDDDLVKVRDEAAAKRQNPFVAGGRIMITERNVDSWVYGRESRGRGWLEASLKQKIDEMGKVSEISDSQKRKLTLAGKGDIQRFEGRVDDLKAAYPPGALRPDKYSELYQKTRVLHMTLQQGLFGSSSLFQKTLVTVLGPEQLARYEQLEYERRTYRYRAKVEMCVAQLDAVLGLRDDQRRRLVQLVLDKTRPPRTYGQLDRFVVLAQMSRLPEEEVKSLLDPAQWPEMRRRLLTAKRMLPMLKQNGVILDEGEEPAKEAEAGFVPKIEIVPKRRETLRN
jgi:hypothetical protein